MSTDAALEALGYVPMRPIRWQVPEPVFTAYEDQGLEKDISKLVRSKDSLLTRLHGLSPDTDSFSLPVAGDLTALSFNEVLVECQRFVASGVARLSVAVERYQILVQESPSKTDGPTREDIEYANIEFEERRRLAAYWIEYARDPEATTPLPRNPNGEVVSPIIAGGLAQRYLVDALNLKTHLEHIEPAIALIQSISDFMNFLSGTIGATGAAYLKGLAEKLERARHKGIRRRRIGVTCLSFLLLLGGVSLDKSLAGFFGDWLVLSMSAAD